MVSITHTLHISREKLLDLLTFGQTIQTPGVSISDRPMEYLPMAHCTRHTLSVRMLVTNLHVNNVAITNDCLFPDSYSSSFQCYVGSWKVLSFNPNYGGQPCGHL